MTSSENFADYSHLADALIEEATKEQLADVARLLALNIGYYREKYGDVPREELLGLIRAENLDEKTERLLLHRMQNLVSALAQVTGLTLEGAPDEIH